MTKPDDHGAEQLLMRLVFARVWTYIPMRTDWLARSLVVLR